MNNFFQKFALIPPGPASRRKTSVFRPPYFVRKLQIKAEQHNRQGLRLLPNSAIQDNFIFELSQTFSL